MASWHNSACPATGSAQHLAFPPCFAHAALNSVGVVTGPAGGLQSRSKWKHC